MKSPSGSTLYRLLAEPAPDEAARGETITTKAKETVDNDVEAFAFEELAASVLVSARERAESATGIDVRRPRVAPGRV